MMLIDDSVAYLEDRPKGVPYLDSEGKQAEFKLDYLVHYHSGSKVGVRVCYAHLVGKWQIEKEFETAVRQIGRAFADKLKIYTENSITPEVASNARTLFHCGNLPLGEINQNLLRLVSSLNGAVPIGTLVSAIEQQNGAFRHVLSLIRQGYLVQASKGLFDRDTLVMRSKAKGVA